MFCPKCGSENKDGAAFCGNCGNKLGTRTASMPTSPVSTSVNTISPTVTAAATKKTGTKIIAIAATVVVALVVAILLFTCSGNKGTLMEGTYKIYHESESDSSYTNTISMTIEKENTITYATSNTYRYSSSDDYSFTGKYEFVKTVDGNNIYEIKDLKLPSGQFATNKDLGDAFGGSYGSDTTLENVVMIIPQNYERGDIKGRWGVVKQYRSGDGTSYVQGVVLVVNEDGKGISRSIDEKEPAVDAICDKDLDIKSEEINDGYSYTFKVVKNAPGRYTLTYLEYDRTFEISIPVEQ